MTLFRQIALLVTAVFLLLLAILVYNDIRRAGESQQGQLQSMARDMATTLGVAIGNQPDGADAATLEALFNAVFDSGYYSRIRMLGTDGAVIHEKSRQIDIEGVPDWFIELVSLKTARGSTRVMRGWSQLGELQLEIHPGFAYRGLYESLISTLRGLALLFAVSMLILWLLLHYLLRPLRHVREQAEAIQANRFVLQERIPSTIELRRVVEAMNLMVSRVQGIFRGQEESLARYQQMLYRDKLTSLGNRRYLLDQLQQSQSEGSTQYGSMAIIKIVELEHLREQHGYEFSDKLLQTLADLLRQDHSGLTVDFVSRFNDDEFAFLSTADDESVSAFIDSLFEAYRDLAMDESVLAEAPLQAGICSLQGGEHIGRVLSGIDYCLSRAAAQGPFSIERKVSTGLDLPQGKMQWRAWFESILESRQLFLVGQLALDAERRPVQRELFVRTRNQANQVVPAGAFMPMASSLGMALDIDREVFRLVAANRNLDRDIPLAINLSSAFFELAEAQEEFDELLITCGQLNRQLCIETSHAILLQHPIMCSKLSERVRRHQHQFGIDNLDPGQSLKLLQSGQFDYVKINALPLFAIACDDQPAGYQALKTIADTVGIRIFAVGVDSQQVFDQLHSFGIEVMQGDYLDQAKPV